MHSSLLSWESGRLTTGRDVNLLKLKFWRLGFAETWTKYLNILVSCSTCFFFILAAHTHSPNPLKTLQRTIRNITISIRTPDSNVSHTLSPSSLPWVPNEKKPHACGLTLDSSMKMVMSFLDLAVLPGGVFHRGKSHRGPELQATTELTRVGFILGGPVVRCARGKTLLGKAMP